MRFSLALACCGLLAGCGAPPQPAAVTFLKGRAANIERTQRAVILTQTRLAGLSRPPAREQLTRLRRSARIARERVNEVRSGLPPFGAAEEELPQAESEVGAGADELNRGLGELVSYAQHPNPLALARYRQYARKGRELWNASVVELWRLAGRSRAPTL